MAEGKQSRRIPDTRTVMSTRGRPSTARGTTVTLRTRPFDCQTGVTPSRWSIWAIPSPSAHMMSVDCQ